MRVVEIINVSATAGLNLYPIEKNNDLFFSSFLFLLRWPIKYWILGAASFAFRYAETKYSKSNCSYFLWIFSLLIGECLVFQFLRFGTENVFDNAKEHEPSVLTLL